MSAKISTIWSRYTALFKLLQVAYPTKLVSEDQESAARKWKHLKDDLSAYDIQMQELRVMIQ